MCKQQKAKGLNHSYNNNPARDNVLKFVKNLPEKQQEQIVFKVLKRKLQDISSDNLYC